MPMG
ncbi:unnamed protein product [Linum tenue]